MSDLRPPRVPCLDHSCACCDEWITSHRQMIASYSTDLDGARRLSDTLWQQVRRLVSDLSRRADDIVTRLRIAGFDDSHHGDLLFQAADEIERLQAIVTTVDDLHSPRLAHDTCLACDCNWPCPTHLLIHPEEARRG